MINSMPHIDASLKDLQVSTDLMQEGQKQLGELMARCPYFDQLTFDKAGKTRSILGNTLKRLADIKKDICLLEYVDKHGLDEDKYLSAKRHIMDGVSSIKSSVDRNWGDTQSLIEQNIGYFDEDNDAADEDATIPERMQDECRRCGELHYENEYCSNCLNEEYIAGHETNENLEQS